MAESNMPPGPSTPKLWQSAQFLTRRGEFFDALTRRHGEAFTIHAAVFGTTAVVTDPALARAVCLADPEQLGRLQPNHSRMLGSGSVFALGGAEHRRRRNLLSPPLHGERVRDYAPIFAEETRREIAHWPQGRPFATLEPLLHIAANSIMRAVFGVGGAELTELRTTLLAGVALGSKLARLPLPSRTYGRYSPWGRLAAWRARYEIILDALIDNARADPQLADRHDMLAVMLRSRYDDDTMMTRKEIGDELLTLLVAGNENVAVTLCWVFERISRHPALLAELTEEADAGGDALRIATIREVQRVRTVIDFIGRRVYAPTVTVGQWVIPKDCSVMVAVDQIHRDPAVFGDPDRFDPQRFVNTAPATFGWLPYGGGTRRCPGSAFANLEMDTVVKTVLTHLAIEASTEPDEPRHSRGVAYAPGLGGRITVRRR